MRFAITQMIKDWLKTSSKVGRVFMVLTKWQYSKFIIFRLIGRSVSLPVYFLLKDKYYKLIIFLQRNAQEQGHSHSPIIPPALLIQAITNDKGLSEAEYTNFLSVNNFTADAQNEWALRFMEVGRMDLARIGFIELLTRTKNKLSSEKMLTAYRYLGAVCFMLGKNDEANYYWNLGGKLRRTFVKPSTPSGYRILGSSWYVALGHIAMLDYYLKFNKLYRASNLRVVAECSLDAISGRDLMGKFLAMGITIVTPGDISDDYNKWAKKNRAPKWESLSSIERASLIDDFWDYDFPDGEILGYAHAAARIERDWTNAANPPLFVLDKIEKKWISQYLMNLGLPKDAWYVCLHVREGGFHKQWNSIYPSLRDADISDYNEAIDLIVSAGGWVLRMGDPSMQSLPAKMNVIDYAHSPYKTPTADILLAAGCRFLLGTNSGYASITSLYEVPCALTNWVPIGWPLWPKKDLMIPKLFRHKATDCYLTIEEVFEFNLAFIQNCSDLPPEFEVVKNTPEDISDLTREMLAQTDSQKKDKDLLQFNTDIEWNYYTEIAHRYGAFTGSRLGMTFLKKHPEIFSPSETEINDSISRTSIAWKTQSTTSSTITIN